MKSILDTISEGRGNTYKFGTPSTGGTFIDYFEEKLSKGDIVVFIDNSFRDSRDFCRAKIVDLIPGKDIYSADYAVVSDVEYPSPNCKPVKKKTCDNLIKISK